MRLSRVKLLLFSALCAAAAAPTAAFESSSVPSAATDGAKSPKTRHHLKVQPLSGFVPSTAYSNQQQLESPKSPEPQIQPRHRKPTYDYPPGGMRKFDGAAVEKSGTEAPGFDRSAQDVQQQLVSTVHHGQPKVSYEELLKLYQQSQGEQVAEAPPTRTKSSTTEGSYSGYPKSILSKISPTASEAPFEASAQTSEDHHHQHFDEVQGQHNHQHHHEHVPLIQDHPNHGPHGPHHGPQRPIKALINKNLEAHAHISIGGDIGHHNSPHHHGHHGLLHGLHGHHAHGHHHLHHGLVPAIGKALKFLVPSALFLTGASALFPKRVHVPTNHEHHDHSRKKRFAPGESHEDYQDYVQVDQGRRRAFDRIPSAYLRAEHRTIDEEEGIELPLSEEDYQNAELINYDDHQDQGSKSELKAPQAAEVSGAQIPPFKPMPVASKVPVIRLNKMTPMSIEEVQALEAVVASDDDANIKNTTSKTEDSHNKLSPKDAMAQLLQATMTSTSNQNVSEAIDKEMELMKSLTNIVASQAPKKAKAKMEQQVKASQQNLQNPQQALRSEEEKPIFRRYSTDKPAVRVMTREPRVSVVKASSTEDSPTKVVSRRNVNISSVDLNDGPGPRILLLGTAEEGTNNDSENSVATDEAASGNGQKKVDQVEGAANKNGKPEDHHHAKHENNNIDLSPDSPVVGLITNYALREEETPECQKRALCELAMRGARNTATKFERFLWNLANLVPPTLSGYYDLEDIFAAIQRRKCSDFRCAKPNLDLQ